MGDGSSLAAARDETEGSEQVTPEEWQQIKKILSGVLERPPSERAAYLDRECPDPRLRKEVDSLIAARDAGDPGFLEQPEGESEELEPGVMMGSYEILSHLGSGGMGEVYRARDAKLRREIALKLLPRDFMRNPGALIRFEREAQVLASLNHPNIVTVYDTGQDGGAVYIAMELVEGKTLDEILTSGPMSIRQILDVAAQVAAGLAVAHKSQIVHRDLKPKNVMVRPDGLVKILDFGLSKLTQLNMSDSGQNSDFTVPGILLGTIDYMSPEQASGRPAEFHSDQFSLGSLVYEITTRRRPFQRATGAETLAAIIEDEPKPLRALNPQAPFALETVIRRCMSKEPEGRYESTDDLARELHDIWESTPSRTTQVGSAIGNRKLRGMPMRLQPTLAAAALFAGMGLLAPRLAERIRTGSQPILMRTNRELVVLPFTNVANDPQNQSFCDGLEEILTSKLSQLEQFQRTFSVVPSTDVLREGIVTVREARQTFGADLAITGSVQRTVDRIRLTINLVDSRTLQQIKSKSIDTEAQDVLALQDGVVLDAVELLDLKLSSQAKQTLSVGGTTAPSAYDFYTQGRGYLQRYELAQNVDAAISLFQQALEKDRTFALAEAALGEAYWRKYEQTKDAKWAEEARKSATTAIQLNDKLAPVYITLGMIDTGTGRYDEAVQSLQKALQIDSISSDAFREMAKAYERMGKLKEAESTYVNAIAARPGYWGTRNDFGGFYYRLGRYADAQKQFQSVVSLSPDNERGYINLGVIAYTQKHYDEAAKLFEKSAALKPTDFAYANLGTIYYTLGQYDDAARYYEQAIQISAHNSQWWHNLAAAYQLSGQAQKAQTAFKRTAELAEQQRRVNPRDPRVLIWLADSYSNLNKSKEARQLLEQALALAPNEVENMFQASSIYERLGDRELALQWISKAIKAGYPRDLIEREPTLAQLRLDPRFREIIGP
jgi:serine/threonine protein kinase/tetratricopeptide (TPR) repeat protein